MYESSSGPLIDIQIEDSLGRETLMSIDNSNRNEDLLSLVFFVCLMLLNVVVGLFGPAPTQHYSVYSTLNHDKLHSQKFATFPIASLSPLNHHLSFGIVPSFTSPNETLTANVSVQTDLIGEKQALDFFAYSLPAITFNRSNQTTEIARVFSHRIGRYKSFSTRVAFRGGQVERLVGCFGQWEIGNKSFTVLEASYRFLFAALILVCCIFFQWKLKGTSIHLWHLEQKMTLILMIIAILMNNPLYYFLVLQAISSLGMVNTILLSVFEVFVKFYILVIFDSLRFKTRKISDCFFTPKLLFFGLFLVFHAELELLRSGIEQPVFMAFQLIVAAFRLIFECAFLVWLGFAVIRSWKDSDVTEGHKFVLYLSVCGVMLFVNACLECFKHLSADPGTCAAFVIRISINNFFVLLMTLFHWPYEVIADQYIGPDEVGLDVGGLYDSD
jgi:hypothetical protein